MDEAVESLTNAASNTCRWALTDHLGTIRDWVEDDGDLLDHAIYDSAGRRLDAALVDAAFGFHGLYNFWMFLDRAGLAAFLSMATPRILGSVQCMRLAKNYLDLKRNDEALMVLQRIAQAHPGGEASHLIATLTRPKVDAPPSRNAPCSCGSGKRYKECHGRPT